MLVSNGPLIRLMTSVLVTISLTVGSSLQAAQSTCGQLLSIRVSDNNTLFAPDTNKKNLNEELYGSTFKKLVSKDIGEITAYLRDQAQLRVLEAEETIAAVDAILPQEPSLFSILAESPRLKFDEREIDHLLKDDSLIKKFEKRLKKSDVSATKFSSSEEFILEIARRLHHFSVRAVGERIVFTAPFIYREQVAAVDRYLGTLAKSFRRSAKEMERLFNKPWHDKPLLREFGYVFGLAWSHPLLTYSPTAEDLNRAIFEPQQHKQQLLLRLGPSTVINWLQTHLMWATLIFFALMIPNQISEARVFVRSTQAMYEAIEKASSPEGQAEFNSNYQRHLNQGYLERIKEWKDQISVIEKKLAQNPDDKDLKTELETLKGRVAYFEGKLTP